LEPEKIPTINNQRYVQIDDEGYLNFGGTRVTDEKDGQEVLNLLRRDKTGRFASELDGHPVWIEAFDEPYVAIQVYKRDDGTWQLQMPYQFFANFDPASLSLDEWDRFHGYTDNGVPFVLSRSAHHELFNLVDEFDDDSITIDGSKLTTANWLLLKKGAEPNQSSFWTNIYHTETPGWELDAPAAPLQDILPQLKITRSRIIVLGCGSGNDAAYFAEKGHIVTAVDISEEAIQRATEKHGHIENLQFIHADMFNLTEKHNHEYDVVFEHTCYCAIDPTRRNELVSLWRRLLSTEGHLLGIFFTWDRRQGPPFGGSEWEIRERLKKNFSFLYWTRWKNSIDKRLAYELVVYAKLRR